jgi:succinate dehydrogenase / fumarate reductase iron-sulfur subunit
MIAANQKTVRVKIKRQLSPGSTAHWETFDVPYVPGTGMNITSVLEWIAKYPKTVEGKATTPITYDAACLEEVCGSCSMLINGKVRQACSQLVEHLLKEQDHITLEPMSKFPLVRDLAVDRERLFNDLKAIRGWVPIDGSYYLGSGPKESPDNQDVRYILSRCMSCGCCLEACPQYTSDNNFVGAAVISQVRYFNRHDTGKQLAGERLDRMMETGGINHCGQAQNCVKVCPKEIPLTESIAEVGRSTTFHAFKRLFSQK